MRDVVIIGGGLSGLAAAYELQKLGLTYTIIEVKQRLGGSIASDYTAGFILDSGPMLHTAADLPAFAEQLAEIGLEEPLALIDGERFLFKQGTRALIDGLARHVTAPPLLRMAVSSLGELDGHFMICLENGLVLDARALVVAAPARYAERMFRTLAPEISFRLLDYRYDSLCRVSLGYRCDDVGEVSENLAQGYAVPPHDYPITAIHAVTHESRVPPGGVLLQIGVRYDPAKGAPPDVVGEIAALMGWPAHPLAAHVGIWPEADPVMWLDSQHAETIGAIRRLLPPGVALAGSDYVAAGHPPRLDQRLLQGRQAAHAAAEWLRWL